MIFLGESEYHLKVLELFLLDKMKVLENVTSISLNKN